MSNKYYIEKLKPIEELAWQEPEVETLAWVQLKNKSFNTITEARNYVDQKGDSRLSYRITDGGRVFSA